MKKINDILIELRPSMIDKGGVGVFAVMNIKKGQKIAEGIHGEDYKDIIPWMDYKKFPRNIKEKINAFCIGTLNGFIPPNNVDFAALTSEWYFNHSCNGNVGFNKNGDFITLRNIKKGEELSYDYGLAESNPKFRMKCTCNSKKCRKIITGNDWKNITLRQKWLPYMLPKLRHYDGEL